MKKNNSATILPTIEEVEQERKRIRRGIYYRKALRGTVSVLVVVAAVAVLIATLFLPILQISGDSMSPQTTDKPTENSVGLSILI